MATECNLAPFINIDFYLTGAYGEVRPDHVHKGVDLSTGGQNAICSMNTGTCSLKSYDAGGYGNYLIIKGDNGMGFLYGDLNNVQINQGDRVTQGQIIAYEGNPPASTGYHVHMEQQDLTNHNWQYTWDSNVFINPCLIMGIPNVVSYVNAYIYYGTPIPPTPISNKNTKKWAFAMNRKINIWRD